MQTVALHGVKYSKCSTAANIWEQIVHLETKFKSLDVTPEIKILVRHLDNPDKFQLRKLTAVCPSYSDLHIVQLLVLMIPSERIRRRFATGRTTHNTPWSRMARASSLPHY
eukprot:12890878-Prorocentrum_lima.AAC.1